MARVKKKADSERLMTWHPAGNGWVKRRKGVRYFIGLRKLAEAFPSLVTSMDEVGSWQAANAWWQAELARIANH